MGLLRDSILHRHAQYCNLRAPFGVSASWTHRGRLVGRFGWLY